MTGYGRGECAQQGFKVTIEVSSVNRKQSEITVNLPRELEVLEAQVRDEVNKVVSRGRLTVRVSIHSAEKAAAGQVRVNVGLAKVYAKEFQKLANELKLADTVSLDLLLRSPGVLHSANEIDEAEDLWPVVAKALKAALGQLLKMREREGDHLEKDLIARIQSIQKSSRKILKHAPEVQKRYREQLRQRIKNSGLDLPSIDDERLIKEVVYFADRSDISEELTRLQSHFQQFNDCLKTKEPVGRTLDFLAQEMNREVNTIGSKANDALISREIVILKAELERFREQVQNVE
ncbi:MAG: YicC family protein [Verrucomicrobia bacterium]|nr:YicC family protein [Verrucomicrobiota bacterium]